MFEYPHGMLSLGAFLYIMNKHNINILSNAEFNQLVVIPEESKPALDKILEKLKQNDGRRIPTEDAKLSKKKLKALYHVSTHKDDFVKPPEKHVHVNPSNESTNAAEKPSNN